MKNIKKNTPSESVNENTQLDNTQLSQNSQMTTEELYQLVKNLTVLDNDNEVNLTPIAKLFGKKLVNWTKSKATKDFFKSLSNGDKSDVAICDIGYLREKKGGTGEQGTYTKSAEVIIEFLRYCSIPISIKMNRIVIELFSTGTVTIQESITDPLQNLEILATQSLRLVKQLREKQKVIEIQEKTIEKQNDRNLELLELKATQSRTGINNLKKDLGVEINANVYKIYNESCNNDFRLMHLKAQSEYNSNANDNNHYNGSKTTSLEAKKLYANWLRIKANEDKQLKLI